jgi:hypothetical protein
MKIFKCVGYMAISLTYQLCYILFTFYLSILSSILFFLNMIFFINHSYTIVFYIFKHMIQMKYNTLPFLQYFDNLIKIYKI